MYDALTPALSYQYIQPKYLIGVGKLEYFNIFSLSVPAN